MDGSGARPPALGITLMLTDRSIHPVELAREVEARGFESLFLPEHSHIPTSRRTPWPGSLDPTTPLPDFYARLVDQTVALSMAAAATERLVLGTAVTLIAQHDPIWLAKQLATQDALSGGRVVVGAGFGWNREEAESHGVVHATRRQLVEEQVGLMRALWRDEVAEYRGELASLEPAWAWPKPTRAAGPPIVLGGGNGPVLFDAICRWADGWMPITARPTLGDRLGRLRDAWAAAGREPDALQVAVMGATTDPTGLEQLGREGVQRAVLTIWSEDRDEILRSLDELTTLQRQLHG